MCIFGDRCAGPECGGNMFPQFSAAIFVDSMVADNSRHLFQVEVSSAAVVGTPRRRCVGVTAPRPAWLSGFQHPGSCTDVGLACPLAPGVDCIVSRRVHAFSLQQQRGPRWLQCGAAWECLWICCASGDARRGAACRCLSLRAAPVPVCPCGLRISRAVAPQRLASYWGVLAGSCVTGGAVKPCCALTRGGHGHRCRRARLRSGKHRRRLW